MELLASYCVRLSRYAYIGLPETAKIREMREKIKRFFKQIQAQNKDIERNLFERRETGD